MEQTSLIEELNKGKELAKQLRNHLRPASSQPDGILLIEKILRSYEKALSVLGGGPFEDEDAAAAAVAPTTQACTEEAKIKDVCKKRKVMAKWSEQVKVSSGAAMEGPLDDGYSWRKYGQKDILGSRFPRGYFRCSHRFAQGCLATKQVQKSDNDPTIYEITYKGRHTCNRVLHSTPTQEAFQKHPQLPKQEQIPLQHEPSCFSFGADAVRVKSETLDDIDGGLFRPFCVPSPWLGSEVLREDQNLETEFGGVSPTFESSDDMFGLCCVGDQAWDSETGFISVPNSVTNVSIGDLDEYWTFDNLELFC